MSYHAKELKILLVENNEVTLQAHQEMFQRINGSLDTAQTGEEALFKVSTNRYDLIFMDIGLSDIDGIEVTEKIRALKIKNSKKIIIVGLTAFDIEDVQQECLSAGMNKVIQKPFHPAVLARLVASYSKAKD